MKKESIFKNKKFRYGAASVVFVAVILALVVVLNAVFSLLASNFHWYVDMTKEQIYTVSDTTKRLLNDLSYDGKIKMIFLQKKDKIEDATETYSGDGYLRQIHELALDYAAQFPDLVDLDYVDMYTEPGKLKDFTKDAKNLDPTSVIFDNGKGLYRVAGYKSFLAFDSGNPIGFYGEHRITATILALSRDRQTAYLTSGHEEDPVSEAFLTILESCGYNNVETVDLKTLTIEKLQEDKPRLVISINPKTDFVGADGGTQKNEIGWLSRILDGSYTGVSDDPALCSLMVFAEPGNELPNLSELTVLWGMSMHTSSADLVKESQRNSFDNAKLYKILPGYVQDGSSLAYSLVKNLISRVAMDGAGTISISDVSARSGVATGPVLLASDDATCENEKYPASGMPVMAIAQNRVTVKNSFYKYNYVLLCADSSVISDEYLRSTSYGNEQLMTTIVRATTDEREHVESVDISYKDYVEEKNVENVSSAHMKGFLITMAAIVPAVLLALGVVIYVKRRNK